AQPAPVGPVGARPIQPSLPDRPLTARRFGDTDAATTLRRHSSQSAARVAIAIPSFTSPTHSSPSARPPGTAQTAPTGVHDSPAMSAPTRSVASPPRSPSTRSNPGAMGPASTSTPKPMRPSTLPSRPRPRDENDATVRDATTHVSTPIGRQTTLASSATGQLPEATSPT